MWSVFQIFILVFAPYLLIKMTRFLKTEHWLTPVLLCYALGILLGNLPVIQFDAQITKMASQVSILFALPLLLFATDLKGWLQYARSTIISFGLCVLSGILMSVIFGIWFQDKISESWKVAGMMTGFFTGGAPNMNAIGMALKVEESLIIYVNACDIICGGLLLLFLTSIAHRVLGLFLKDFEEGDNAYLNKNNIGKILNEENKFTNNFSNLFKATGLAIGILAAAIGLTRLFTGAINSEVLIIFLLTLLSVFASFFQKVRNLRGSFEMGEYCLLIFSVAIGLMADFSNMLAESSQILWMMFGVMYGTFLLHLLLAKIFNIDRDTFMITAVAAIYGPAFIGQIASVIGNRTLLFSGMATGLVGYAVGNFLGIGVANILQLFADF